MKKSWQISLVLLLIISLIGVFVSGKNPFELDPKVVPGDVAWMLTATALVLFMTPGTRFFLWRDDPAEKYYFNNAAKFCGYGSYKLNLGYFWVQPGFW